MTIISDFFGWPSFGKLEHLQALGKRSNTRSASVLGLIYKRLPRYQSLNGWVGGEVIIEYMRIVRCLEEIQLESWIRFRQRLGCLEKHILKIER